MDTALLVVVMSFFSLVGAALAGGGLVLGATRLVRFARARPSVRVSNEHARESLH